MNILITGGTGLVGSRLIEMLLEKGHGVRCLSRTKRKHGKVKNYQWDVSKNSIDEKALEDIHAVIHLAGENVGAQKWTTDRKQKIIKSRSDSAQLLYQAIEASETKPKVFISASGVGYYGQNTGDNLMKENAPKGDGFLSDVVEVWESGADKFNMLDIRVVKLRIGLVLSNQGGALSKISQPIKYGVGAVLGNGNQNVSWIHIDDLCRMLLWVVEKEEINGVFNAAATETVTNRTLTHIIANALKRKIILPNVPAFVLKMMLGEMSSLVLGGNKVSNDKIKKLGFEFKYHDAKEAIYQILKKN